MRPAIAIRSVTLVLVLSACTAGPTLEKAKCPNAHTVYVADHGDHTGLVVSRERLIAALPALAEDLPAAPYVEIGWGDARYYPTRDPGFGLALRAALWPTASVLHLVALPEPPAQYFFGAEVVPVGLSETGHRRLLAFVAESFERTASGAPRRLGPPMYGQGGFYAAKGGFHLFNTCNTWIARGLARADYPVSTRWVVTAEDLLSQLRETGCPSDTAGKRLSAVSAE